MLDFIESAPVFTEQAACLRADARCMASRLIRCLYAKQPSPAYFSYGNENEVILCNGKQIRSSKKRASHTGEAETPWQHVHDIFEQHEDDYIFGYLGYGFGLIADSDNDEQFPPYWFGVADLAIQCTPAGFTLLHGDAQALHLAATKMAKCACGQNKVELVAALDQSDEAHYLAQVEQVLDWVHKEPARRMTVARRVPLPAVDLLQTFHCQPSHNSLSRSFYLDIGSAAFVGKCPEVLLEWTPGKFNAYKLSGTYPKDKNPEIDERLLEQFLSDPKIIAEHRLSADGFGAGVAKVGDVSRQGPNVLNLDRLRHMMTAFSVSTDSGKTITDCLRAVLPPGVSPCAEGIPALLAIEKAKRGPYYGLVGMYSPDKKASFTQILRSVFRQHDDYYAWVGAAVTQGSTAKGELEESKLKLSDIVVSLK
jgi:anthranilate/para-aminobenzoate synthase component I